MVLEPFDGREVSSRPRSRVVVVDPRCGREVVKVS